MANRRKTAYETDLAGNPSRRPQLFDVLQAEAVDPKDFTPPDWLDSLAKAEWERIVPELDHCCPVDKACLASYCQAYSHWQAAVAELNTQPLTVTSPRGIVQPNPLLKIADRFNRTMLAYAKEMGLTPLARSRMPQAKADEMDPTADAFTSFMRS